VKGKTSRENQATQAPPYPSPKPASPSLTPSAFAGQRTPADDSTPPLVQPPLTPCARIVLAAVSPSDRSWALAEFGLLRSMAQLSQIDHGAISVDEIVEMYESLVQARTVSPTMLTEAGRVTAAALMDYGHSFDAARILSETVCRLPAVAWRGSDRRSRESQLAEVSGLASDAAACQLAAGNPEAAVEVLETGRAVLWTDMLQLRRGDARLWAERPDVASRLRDLAAALDMSETAVMHDSGISRYVDQRMALASEWDDLVEQIRTEWSTDFLKPPPIPDLFLAAAGGPVVIVNVSRYRCDALIVTTMRGPRFLIQSLHE
jgi:hypothetical protein